jgi:hypothetical protein
MSSFSVGLFPQDEISSLLADRDAKTLGLVRSCDRVSIWHEATKCWRAPLVAELMAKALFRFQPERLVKVGRQRRIVCEGEAAQHQFLAVTEPSGQVHDRYVLTLSNEPISVFLLTDADGQALDILICGDEQHSLCRNVGKMAWELLITGS